MKKEYINPVIRLEAYMAEQIICISDPYEDIPGGGTGTPSAKQATASFDY